MCRTSSAETGIPVRPDAGDRLAWHADDDGLRNGIPSGRLFGDAVAARLAEVARSDGQTTERLRTLRRCRERTASPAMCVNNSEV